MSQYAPLITSKQNPKVKSILREMRKPSAADFVVVEGTKLVDEAMRAGLHPSSLWCLEPYDRPFHGPVFRVTEQIFKALAPSKNPQSPLALFHKPVIHDGLRDLPKKGAFLLLDQVQDPGNGGALVRAAVAFGFSGMIWHEPCLYPFHPKCIRASAGSVFHIRHFRLEENACEKLPLPVLTTGVGDALNVTQVEWPEDFILALGNEGHGVSPAIEKQSHATLKVPYPGRVESLNVTGAAYIILFNWHHRKVDQQ